VVGRYKGETFKLYTLAMEIKIFKTKKSFKKGGLHINPDIYWGLTLAIAFILALIFVIFGFYLFAKINKELTMIEPNNVEVETINKSKIDETLEYFSSREKKSSGIINSPSPVIDPSL